MTTSALELQNLYLDYVDDTECPTIYHRWSFIAGIGAMLERNIYLPFGHDTIYPNQYVVLLGSPATRKSTAINALGQLLKEAGYEKFAGDKSSKEKFIQDLSNGFDLNAEHSDDLFDIDNFLNNEEVGNTKPEISAVFIKASELQDFLGMNNHDFIAWLTHMWDCPDNYDHRTKTEKSDRINKPTISLLGGATPQTFTSAFPTNILEQGMMSRMLLVHGEGRRKKIAFPSEPCPEKRDKLVQKLVQIKNQADGRVSMSHEAKTMLESIYENWQELPDTRFATYAGRRFTHLLKLCIIHAAMRLSKEINKEDVLLANTLLSYTEKFMPLALGEFGKTDKGRIVGLILDEIKKAKDGISFHTLQQHLVNENVKGTEILSHIDHLKVLGRIDSVVGQDEFGSKVTTFHFIKPNTIVLNKYVDFSLLRENSFKTKVEKEDEDNVGGAVSSEY